MAIPAPVLAASTAPNAGRDDSSGPATPERIQKLIRDGLFAEAEREARALLRAQERIYGGESMQAAEALDLVAEAMRHGSRTGLPEARGICERAVRIKERLAGRNSAACAASIHNLGALHMMNGDHSLARPLLEDALRIRTRVFGESHPEVARSLMFLANLEVGVGRNHAALPLIERAAAITRALGPDDPDRTRATTMLATIRYNLGDYLSPVALWEEVLSSARRTRGEGHPFVGETLHNLGALATETGDCDQALIYLEQALRIRRNALGPHNPYVAATLEVMSSALRQRGDLAGAMARCRKALRIRELPDNKNQTDVAWTLRWMGALHAERKEYARARALLARARRIQERELGSDNPEIAWTLHSLALVAEGQGRRAEADSLYWKALRVKETVYGASYPDVVTTQGELARFLASSGDSARAFELALHAAHARVDHLRVTAQGLSERQALAYAEMGSQPLDVLQALAPSGGSGRVAAAWDALIRSRTLVLDEIASRHGAALAGDGSISGPRRELDAARRRYANLLVRGIGNEDPDRWRADMERSREDVERAERAVAARSRPFQDAMRRERAGWKEVSAELPDGWDLLAFALHGAGAERCYSAFIARRGTAPVAVRLGRAAEIDAAVQRFVNALRRGDRTARGRRLARRETECRAAGKELRRRIWDPLQGHLRGADRLFVVPEGSLHLVNLAALPSGPHSYLVEDGPMLQYLSAERDLLRPRRHKGHGLLALGGAAFDVREDAASVEPGPAGRRSSKAGPRDSGIRRSTPRASERESSPVRGPQPECREFRNARFRPLEETGREVDAIAAAWGKASETVTLTGPRAGEASLKALAPGRRVLHLATHGFFLDATRCVTERSRPRGTRGIGSVAGSAPSARPAPARRGSPLLVSGLALAGANLRLKAAPDEEDGILMAQEVASLDLSAAEWVVLSACDTGLGRLQAGEGVLGLRRAFESAGASAVIMSLWEVEDRSTREWMRHLYESRFRRGRSTPEAVRDADLAVLRDRRAQGLGTHPFYWAGFVAAGDWR